MSGNDPEIVELAGPAMVSLVDAIPQVEQLLGQPIVLVGGLAVLSRLGSAYRVTSDVDTVNRREPDAPARLDILLKHGATRTDAAGAVVETERGEVRFDILEVSTRDLADPPEDPTDRLYLLAFDWALQTATPLRISVTDGDGHRIEASVLVAQPGPLVATKLQALPNRSQLKEATDLLDIIRLVLDQQAGAAVREQLRGAGEQLRADARLHVQRWFAERAERSHRLVTSIPDGREVDYDTIILVGELLTASLFGVRS